MSYDSLNAGNRSAATWHPGLAPPASHYELTPRDLATLAAHVGRAGAEETSFDDLFDDSAYRVAQTSFAGRPHPRKPRGQTFYRESVRHAPQGLPEHTSSAHWHHLSETPTLPTTRARRRLVWAAARDSGVSATRARPEPRGWGARTYSFAG